MSTLFVMVHSVDADMQAMHASVVISQRDRQRDVKATLLYDLTKGTPDD